MSGCHSSNDYNQITIPFSDQTQLAKCYIITLEHLANQNVFPSSSQKLCLYLPHCLKKTSKSQIYLHIRDAGSRELLTFLLEESTATLNGNTLSGSSQRAGSCCFLLLKRLVTFLLPLVGGAEQSQANTCSSVAVKNKFQNNHSAYAEFSWGVNDCPQVFEMPIPLYKFCIHAHRCAATQTSALKDSRWPSSMVCANFPCEAYEQKYLPQYPSPVLRH